MSVKKVDLEFTGGLTSGSFCTVETFVDGVLKDLTQNANLITGGPDSAASRVALHTFLTVKKKRLHFYLYIKIHFRREKL